MTNPEPSNDRGGGATWPVIAVVGAAIVLLAVPIWWLVQNLVLSDSTDSTLLEAAATTTSPTNATAPTPTTVGQVTTTTTVFEDTTPISGGTTSTTTGATTNTTGGVGTPTTSPESATTAPPTTTPPTTTPPTTTPPTTTATGAVVTIVGFAFGPKNLTVAVGTTVTWTNHDGPPHTTTSDAPGWNSPDLGTGDTFQVMFDKPGTFTYHCSIHPSMTATVTVEG